MKNLYSVILIVTLHFFNLSVTAQISEKESGEFINKEDILKDFDEIMRRGGPLCCFGETSVPNLTFTYTRNSALTNHDRVQLARERALNAWFNKQYENFKKEIEKQLKKTYPNFEQAKNDYFKNVEKRNILRNANGLKNKYDTKVKVRNGNKEKSLRNLKLLELRRIELNLGNINNTSYGSFNFNGTPIGDIRNLSQLNGLREQEFGVFGHNEWKLNDDTGILRFLYSDIIAMGHYTNANNYNFDILNELLTFQNNHFRTYGSWQQLDLMQLYLNNVRIPVVLIERIFAQDYGTTSFLENYANQHRRGGTSIFDPAYENEMINEAIFGRQYGDTIEEAIEQAEYQVEIERLDYIDDLLGTISTIDLRTQSVIETLGYTNDSDEADWLDGNQNAGEDMFNLLDVSNLTESEKQQVKDMIDVLRNSSLTEEQKFELLLDIENQYNPTPINITQTDLDRIIRKYAKEFRRRGNIEFADYLESLLPIDPKTFTQGDYWDLINLIKREKVRYTLNLTREIIIVTYESFKPVIEYALFEVGGTLAFKLLSKLPVRYLARPIRNIIARLSTKSSQAWNSFQHAKKFGFKTFDEFVQYFKSLNLGRSELGVNIHHLFEQRLARSPAIRNFLGSNTGNWKSIILTPTEHQNFTNAWRNAIGYEGQAAGWTGFNTNNVTVEAMKRAAREIYKDYPEILKALGL